MDSERRTSPRRASALGLALALAAAPALARPQEAEAARRARLQPAVNRAIDAGIEALLRRQHLDGAFGSHNDEQVGHWDHRNGQTAFVLYTLLECRVPREHPAVRRAVAYLLQDRPRRTYTIATQLMAFAAHGGEELAERREELLDALLELREKSELGWRYPGHYGARPDLSNTQVAALGLRAARKAGLRVPKRVWTDLLELGVEWQVQVPAGRNELAPSGWPYTPGEGVTASMTAAGLSVLGIAVEGLDGAVPRALAEDVERAQDAGLRWMAQNFSASSNPGGAGAWLYYWLYGVERVGALAGLDRFGEHDWYWEGAEELVKRQAEDGSWSTGGDAAWPPQPMTAANTCLALLFLVKATAPSTGGPEGAVEGTWAAEGPECDVGLRAAGAGRMSFWVTGFGDEVARRYAHGGELARGLRVVAVEYLVDGEVAAEVAGDPLSAWQGERFAVQHRFERSGGHTVQARVRLLRPEPRAAGEGPEVVLSSEALAVRADDVLEEWMLDYARAHERNLLLGQRLDVRASSALDPKHTDGRRAFDDMQFGGWVCAEDDAAPALAVDLAKPLRGARFVFGPLGSSEAERGEYARPTRVALALNGDRDEHVFDWNAEWPRKAVLELPRRATIRSFRVRILERDAAGAKSPATGFAEIELYER